VILGKKTQFLLPSQGGKSEKRTKTKTNYERRMNP